MIQAVLRALFFGVYVVLLAAMVWLTRGSAENAAPSSSAIAVGMLDEAPDSVLPAHDNVPLRDAFSLGGRSVYPALKMTAQEDDQGQLLEFFDPVGYAFEIKAKGPFGSSRLLVGIDSLGRITGVKPLELKEARGLASALIKADFFWESFKGLTHDQVFLSSRGGKIPEVAGGVEAVERYSEAVRLALEEALRVREIWNAAAMKGRRSSADLEELRDLNREAEQPAAEGPDENAVS